METNTGSKWEYIEALNGYLKREFSISLTLEEYRPPHGDRLMIVRREAGSNTHRWTFWIHEEGKEYERVLLETIQERITIWNLREPNGNT